jgi:O-antigen/teichoic acid export membrane protein
LAFSVGDAIGRLRPGLARDRLEWGLEQLRTLAGSADDRSVSQRIALIAFATRIVSAVIAYLSQVLLARWMGEYEYGIFAVVWVGAVILGGLSCTGFQKSVLRFVPEHSELRQESLLRGIIVGARVYGLIIGTVTAALGIGGLYLFGDHLSDGHIVPLYLAAVCLPMLAVTEISEGLSRAYSWANLSLWPTFIVRPLLILLFMWAAILLGHPANAVTAMGAVIAATYITTIGHTIALNWRLRGAVPKGPRAYSAWTWFSISLPIFMVDGFFNLMTNVDVIIVGYLMPPQSAAIYYASVKTMALVHFVYFAVRAGSAQRFAGYHAAGDRKQLEAFVRDTLHWTFWPSLAMAGVLIVLGWPMLRLFGPSFVVGYPLLFIFIAGLLMRASVGPAESLLSMANQQGIAAIVYLATFVLNVGLNFALVPHYGLTGAAIATATALVVEAVGLFLAARARLGINCSIFFVLRQAQGRPG